MMTQSPMSEIREHLLSAIEPIVYRLIVLDFAAKAVHGGLCVKEWVRHTPSCSVVW